jgi:hypothetical protein
MAVSTTQVFIRSQAALTTKISFLILPRCNYLVCILFVVSLHSRDMSLLGGHRRHQELPINHQIQSKYPLILVDHLSPP